MAEAAIVIPHYQDVNRLERCLDALMPQVLPYGGNVEVVVVDNGSADDVAAACSGWSSLRLVVEDDQGAAHARNRGVAETTAPRIFFLDCDCVPASDWLSVALETADMADLVGGAVTVFDETAGPRSGAEAFETVFAFDNRSYIKKNGFSVTANLLTMRIIFDTIGGFRPEMSEDFDWCRRAIAAGFHLAYEDALRVAHPTRSDWPALERKWRRLTNESWGLAQRRPGARFYRALRGLAMIPSIAVHGPKVLRHNDLRSSAERWAALTTLAALRMRRCIWMLRQAVGLPI